MLPQSRWGSCPVLTAAPSPMSMVSANDTKHFPSLLTLGYVKSQLAADESGKTVYAITASGRKAGEKSDGQTHDEKHWQDNYPVAVECARWYRDLLSRYHRDVRAKF